MIIFVIFYFDAAKAVNIPQEWKDLLELLEKENEGPLGPSQPIIRELISFPTVAAKLAATVNAKVLIVLA